jgi:hypothetical protein
MPRSYVRFNTAQRCPSCDVLFSRAYPKGPSGKCFACEAEALTFALKDGRSRGYIGDYVASCGYEVRVGAFVEENRSYKSEWAGECESCGAAITTKGATRCKRCASKDRWATA